VPLQKQTNISLPVGCFTPSQCTIKQCRRQWVSWNDSSEKTEN